MITKKPWGEEDLLHQGYGYAVKKILLNDGQRTSLHYHVEKHEFIFVVEGTLEVEIADGDTRQVRSLSSGGFLAILPGQVHRMASQSGDVLYLESQTDHLDDVVRLSDDFDRT